MLLLNNDAVAEPGLAAALERAAAARPDAGLLACKILSARRRRASQYAGADFNASARLLRARGGYGRPDPSTCSTSAAPTAPRWPCRARPSSEAGLLDETLFAYVEDVEWSLRIRAAGLRRRLRPGRVVCVTRARPRPAARASTTNLYYDTRNTIVVSERYAPLPAGPARAAPAASSSGRTSRRP